MKTPVALIIFNRPDFVARMLSAIAAARPAKLLVIADGPRADRPDDIEKCAAARRVIERVDWDCEILTNYSDINLGCGLRPATGIDWVFAQVEEAIILEDDCLPHPSFFPFCEELLARYRDDERVMMIGGVNFLGEWRTPGQSYYFSRFGGSWGWASWRRAWQHFDFKLALWPEVVRRRVLEAMFPDPAQCAYWREIFQQVYAGRSDVWDYQWLLACWINSGYRIFPEVNLISNIGFGADATHTFGESPLANMPAAEIALPLRHPPFVTRSVEADAKIMAQFCPPSALTAAQRDLAQQLKNHHPAVVSSPLKHLVKQALNVFGFEIKRQPSSKSPEATPSSAFDREADEQIALVRAHTMLPYARLYSLYHQAVHCEQIRLPGSFVECGTWKGGAVGLMALANLTHGKARRQLHLFDSFAGIPEPDEAIDGAKAVWEARQAGGGAQGQLVPLKGFYEVAGTLEANRHLLETIIGYDPDCLHYHQGWFQETLPRDVRQIGPIAILRLDGDWYASTKVCLDHLYDLVVSGGFVIIDDYGCYEGCQRAVDEFRERRGINAYLHRIDSQGVYWVKP